MNPPQPDPLEHCVAEVGARVGIVRAGAAAEPSAQYDDRIARRAHAGGALETVRHAPRFAVLGHLLPRNQVGRPGAVPRRGLRRPSIGGRAVPRFIAPLLLSVWLILRSSKDTMLVHRLCSTRA
jgi:hypothetical protein